MTCFAAMTIEKAEIFININLKCMHFWDAPLATRRFPNLSNNQNSHTGVFM